VSGKNEEVLQDQELCRCNMVTNSWSNEDHLLKRANFDIIDKANGNEATMMNERR